MLLPRDRSFWREVLASAVADGNVAATRSIECPFLRQELRTCYFSSVASFLLPLQADEGCDDSGAEWCITELTQRHQLISEGRVMKHCVASYWQRCRSGKSAIFSLRHHRIVDHASRMESTFTIEVDRESNRIVQVRGKNNRYVRACNVPIIRRWAGAHRLAC